MKKLLIAIVILFSAFSLSATNKGFKAKIFNEKDVHIMNLEIDYANNKAKIETSAFTQAYYILHNITTEDKSILYLGVLPIQLFNQGNYDKSKEEKLIFNLKKSTFSINDTKKEFKCEFYEFE